MAKKRQTRKNNKVVVVPVPVSGSGLRMTGNGFLSDMLGKIPVVGGIAGAPLRMVGLGRQRGRGKYGDLLAQSLSPWMMEGSTQLQNLVRRI